MLRSDYCSDYERQKSEFQNSIATIVATTSFKNQFEWPKQRESIYKEKKIEISLLSRRLAARAQASRFGTKTQLAGRTLTPMPPPGGKLTVELRIVHRRSRLLRGVGRIVPTCAVLQTDCASTQVCATQTPRPPTVAA